MLREHRAVSNPLTIIAIFAALAEIAGTVVLGTLTEELQSIFLWYVMLFPVGIVLLFFAILNFNPSVLYAPSDFRDDANFLETMNGRRSLLEQLKRVGADLQDAKEQLAKLSERNQTAQETALLVQMLRNQLAHAQTGVEASRASVESLPTPPRPLGELSELVLEEIISDPENYPTGVARKLGEERGRVIGVYHRLKSRGLIEHVDKRWRPVRPKENE